MNNYRKQNYLFSIIKNGKMYYNSSHMAGLVVANREAVLKWINVVKDSLSALRKFRKLMNCHDSTFAPDPSIF